MEHGFRLPFSEYIPLVTDEFLGNPELSVAGKPVGGDKERRARNLGEAIGALVTDFRKQRSWSQQELAHRVGCNESTVRILEMATKSPTLRTLENVAGAFSMDVVALITAAKRRIRL